MTILIMRHGESQADILKVHEGRSEFSLTEKGKSQALTAAQWIHENYNIKKIYCSPLKRAYQTGKIVSKEVSSEIVIEDGLMEADNGLLAGVSREEATQKYPRIWGLPIHVSAYEMETSLQFRFRAEEILSKILSQTNEDETILIISHGGTINRLYHAFLKLPIDSKLVFSTGDTGIHEWEIEKEERKINFTNKICR